MKKALLILGLLLLVGCSINGQEDINEFVFEVDNLNNSLEFGMGTASIQDYSDFGFYQIKPDKGKKLIFLECINSTLIIKDNMIYCESNTQN